MKTLTVKQREHLIARRNPELPYCPHCHGDAYVEYAPSMANPRVRARWAIGCYCEFVPGYTRKLLKNPVSCSSVSAPSLKEARIKWLDYCDMYLWLSSQHK